MPTTFRAKILQTGQTAAGIEVPAAIVSQLGGGRHPKVRVTINDYTYRSSVAVMGNAFMVGVTSEHRIAARVAAGDTVEVTLELDTAPREVEVPRDFAAALDADPPARRTFDSLSYSNKRWHTLSIEGARTDETRQRRIAKSVATLHEGRPR